MCFRGASAKREKKKIIIIYYVSLIHILAVSCARLRNIQAGSPSRKRQFVLLEILELRRPIKNLPDDRFTKKMDDKKEMFLM